MVQCFRTMVQSRFSKIVQSCNSLVLLGLQDFESWFVEVAFYPKACLVCLGLIATANSALATITTGYIVI